MTSLLALGVYDDVRLYEVQKAFQEYVLSRELTLDERVKLMCDVVEFVRAQRAALETLVEGSNGEKHEPF